MKRVLHGYVLCNNTPRAAKLIYKRVKLQIHAKYITVRDAQNQQLVKPIPNPRKQGLPSDVVLSILTWAWQRWTWQQHNKCNATAIHSDWLHVQLRTDARQTNSAECSFQILGSTGLVVEHAHWKKDMARYIGLRFHAASKVLMDARELAKAKRFELKRNAEFNWSWNRREALRKASKSPYLRKARASALRCMQLPAVCSARRNHGKNKMSAKCLLQIICIQSVKENFCEFLEWVGKNSDLAHLCWDVGGNAHPPCANQADCLPELTSK